MSLRLTLTLELLGLGAREDPHLSQRVSALAIDLHQYL